MAAMGGGTVHTEQEHYNARTGKLIKSLMIQINPPA